jgi:hypothetical protein
MFGTLANVFGMVLGFIAVAGVTYLVFWFIKTKILAYNVPVTLKFEVGGSILEKQDKIKVTQTRVEFKKNRKLLAEVPQDTFAFYKGKRFGATKMFEGFVRNNNVAWMWPKPETQQVVTGVDKDGKPVQQVVDTFITVPTNLIEVHVAESRRNMELTLKLKWWQNPVLLSYAAIGFMLVALIFIYMLYKGIPESINGYVAIVKSTCGGVQIQ